MKEPRIEKIVAELQYTVDRLNRLTNILAKSGTTFYLHRPTIHSDFVLSDIEQRVKYE
jgi:hypothetical protein